MICVVLSCIISIILTSPHSIKRGIKNGFGFVVVFHKTTPFGWLVTMPMDLVGIGIDKRIALNKRNVKCFFEKISCCWATSYIFCYMSSLTVTDKFQLKVHFSQFFIHTLYKNSWYLNHRSAGKNIAINLKEKRIKRGFQIAFSGHGIF